MFEKLRATTVSVISPMFQLLQHRINFIKRLMEYIKTLPGDHREIERDYNFFVEEDNKIAMMIRGEIEDIKY